MNRLVISAMLLVGAVASTLAAEIEVINDKAAFPEGPVVVDGKLYYTEYGGFIDARREGHEIRVLLVTEADDAAVPARLLSAPVPGTGA